MLRYAIAGLLAAFMTGLPVNAQEAIVVDLEQTIYPPAFSPDPIIVEKGIPVRILATTKQREHVNRISILPWISRSDTLRPGKTTIIEFTPDQTGEFAIRNIGHGFTGTLKVVEAEARATRAWGDPIQITNGFEVNSVQFLRDGMLLFSTDTGVIMSRVDGSDMRPLFSVESIRRANMSPDGGKVVLDNDLDIFVANRDGSDLIPIANNPDLFEFGVSFTPDGKKITFVTIDDVNAIYGIWMMNPDGSEKTNLISSKGTTFRHPRQSPDGTKLSFFSFAKGEKPRIWVKGNGQTTALTTAEANDASRHASWSIDGKQLAFSSRKGGDFNIWIMHSDGTDKAQITNIQGDEAKPVWGPDGQAIAFVCSDCLGRLGSDLFVVSRVTEAQ